MSKKRKHRTLYEIFFKRFFDVFLSIIALLLLSPVIIIVYIINLFVLKGNPIFAQYRPGKGGKIFKLYKFRSMTNAVDKDGNPLPDEQRVTKFGKFIRKFSLDELPQLINIIKGDMSIVGPRPRIIKDVIFYDEYALKAYSVRPGLTGLSQISGGRSTAPFEDIIEMDVAYTEHITLFNDLKIIFKTFGVLFTGSSTGGGQLDGRQDYYYSSYLLRTGKISQQQYEEGVKLADNIIETAGKVTYQKNLHNSALPNEDEINE